MWFFFQPYLCSKRLDTREELSQCKNPKEGWRNHTKISMKSSFSLDTVQNFRFLDTNKSQWYDWWKVIQEPLWLDSIRLLLPKKIIHYKRRSKQRWEWGRGWRNKNKNKRRGWQCSQEQKCRYKGGWWCGRWPRRAPVVFS